MESSPSTQTNGGGTFIKRYIKKRLPILKWLPTYKAKDIVPDTISGISVGLTAIPQSIAYANVAGLTPEYGLYSSFVSCFVYIFLGSCRQMTIGPTALMELLVFETCGQDFPKCVVLVGFYAGCFQFLMGLLKLGAVVSIISDPVTIGFVGGASLTICSSQIKSFLGLGGPKGDGFLDSVIKAVENIKSAKLGDSLLGLGCVIFLLICKNLKDYVKPPPITTRKGFLLTKFLWVLSISRNAVVVIIATALAAALSGDPFALTGPVKKGFPPVAPPQFNLPTFPNANATSNETTISFWETWEELGTAPLTIAVISILQNVAIAKAFGSGQSIDATQEMIALGVSHVVASFFSSMPTAGSFTRSAVNEASGVRSPFGGIATAALVLFALSFLTEWFQYIPKASLAAVILCAVLPMIEYESIWPMWKVSKLDVLTTTITFLASLLLGMEYGIVIGVGVSLALYLVQPVRPKVEWTIVDAMERGRTTPSRSSSEDRLLSSEPGQPDTDTKTWKYHLIKPEQGFCFPSVDAIRTRINKVALNYPDIKVIALHCQNMTSMDYTSASALSCLVNALKKTGKSLVFVGCRPSCVAMMETVGLKEPECYDNLEELVLKRFTFTSE